MYHYVSAEAPAGSWGPLCNPENQRDWAPGWRISVPPDWTHKSSSGASSFYDIWFTTPGGFPATVAWTDSTASSQAYSGGTPVGEVDFDGETVLVSDSSDEMNQILSINFIAQSVGGLVDVLGGEPVMHQVSLSTTLEMGVTQDDATAILTSMRRERCAIFDALTFEYAYQDFAVLPVFDGGDPLGKSVPPGERLPFDLSTAILNPYATYTDAQLAYIVGFDQATSECFVANLRPTIPTDPADLVLFADPVTPESDEQVAALNATLIGC